MAKMRVAQVPRPNGSFELVERDIPEPPGGRGRVKVQACGICHSTREPNRRAIIGDGLH